MKRWILTIFALFAGVSVFAADDIGARMAFLEKNAPYLAKVYVAFAVNTPQGQGTNYGSGSGFLYIDEKNRCGIYTNSHVLGPSTTRNVNVVFDGQKDAQKSRVISRDPVFDLALVECPPSLPNGMVSAKLGTADDIWVGQSVYAAGYPFGVRSVTYGLINSIDSPAGPQFFVNQTPLSPGNSGGPLFAFTDMGEPVIIGINTAGALKGFQSHTIHISHIRKLLPRLWDGESMVLHGALNMWWENVRDVNPAQFEAATNTPYPPLRSDGLVVLAVQRGSSAGFADIQPGDIIVGMKQDGADITFSNAREFFIEIVTRKPGDTVELTILRKGESLQKTVKLDEFVVEPE
ncbi:MAG: serine protease [Candidatus Niyogibacteria bacterium]|nr:serine protease [Candidatus Niyogibacteria bacterium]